MNMMQLLLVAVGLLSMIGLILAAFSGPSPAKDRHAG